jgi:drug/metabolite transporter (DMT)-like permease
LCGAATYLGLRILIETIPLLLGGTLRYLVPAALLAAFVVTRRGPAAFKTSWRGLASTAVVGLLPTGGNGMFPLAEQHISTGLTALIIAAVPLWLALLQAAAGDWPSARTFAGVVTGFGGVALLSLSGDRGTNGGLGIVIVLGASLSWSAGSFLVPRLPMPQDTLVALVYELTAGGLALIPIGLARGESLDLVHVSLRSLLAVGYLVVFVTLIAFTSYSWLARSPE